jgi:hypothetical protein
MIYGVGPRFRILSPDLSVIPRSSKTRRGLSSAGRQFECLTCNRSHTQLINANFLRGQCAGCADDRTARVPVGYAANR